MNITFYTKPVDDNDNGEIVSVDAEAYPKVGDTFVYRDYTKLPSVTRYFIVTEVVFVVRQILVNKPTADVEVIVTEKD